MNRATTRDRLERLELLSSRLKADEPMTVAALSTEFGISARTLARDLDLLRQRGLPIEADRGRGGGIRLHRNWGIGRLNLTYREAVDLLVSMAIAEQLKSPLLIANLSSIRRKLVASFSPALRDRIDGLRTRILVGRTASAMVLGGFVDPRSEDIGRLFQAFLELRLFSFAYSDVEGRTSSRVVEPQYLLLNYPVWYLIGWDRNRDAVRSFRCDRIAGADIMAETFRMRPFEKFASAIEGTGAIIP